MNSENFVIQSSLEANYLNIQLEEDEKLDNIAVKVIKDDCPEFLIPFRLMTMNDRITLKYKLMNTIAVEYTNMTLPKNLFIQLYLNLISPFIKGNDWFLDYHNLCIDGRYVFIEKHTNQVFYIYIPAESFRNTDEEIIEFLKNVFINTTITDDKDFQVQLFRFFGSGQVTLAGLYQLLQTARTGRNSEKTVFGNVKTQLEQQVQMQSQPVKVIQSEEKKSENKTGKFFGSEKKGKVKEAEVPQVDYSYQEGNAEDEVIQALFGEKKKAKASKTAPKKKQVEEKKQGKFSGLFSGKKKQEKDSLSQEQMIVRPSDNTGSDSGRNSSTGQMGYVPMFSVNEAETEETEIFAEDSVGNGRAWLELLDFSQHSAMQRIELNFLKPYLSIGRMSSDELKPDIAFPSEFKRIGRQHARIEKRGEALFIIDLGSVNHTMLNGQILVPNQPYQLFDGMELAFTVSKPLRYRVHL